MANPFAQGSSQPSADLPSKSSDQPTQPSGNPFAAVQPKPKKHAEGSAAAGGQQPTEGIQPEIPKGAVGLDNNGQPYFGDGIPGILKKWRYNFTKDVKAVDEQGWTDLKARWQKSMQAPGSGNTKEFLAGQAEQAGIIGEAISKKYQDITASAQGSVLAPVVQAVNATVPALGDLFSLGAQKTEQSLGAIQETSLGLNDIIHSRYNEQEFSQFVKDQPLDNTSGATNLALSPSDNKWEYLKMKMEDGWQSGRILYSQVFDSTLKEKYIQEYRQGGDPNLIAQKLQNPLAELAGQLILDPLNLVGAFGKASKVAKELDAVHDSLTASNIYKTEKGVAALKAIDEAQDEVSAVKAFDALTEARMEANAAAVGKSKLLNVGYGINDLTTTSRQNAIIGRGKEQLGNMALVLRQSGMSSDAIAEAVLYGAKSVSENADEVKAGLAALKDLPNANMWLSDGYAETFTVVKKLLQGENGALDGSKLTGLMKASNPAEFAESATKLMAAATLTEFPDVSELGKAAQLAAEAAKGTGTISQKTLEMAAKYEALPNHVKYLNEINNTLSKYIKNPINKILSPLYFNLQGGVAVKNIVSNNELILIDKGAGAWFKDGKYWSNEGVTNFLKDTFEELPDSAHGFKSMVSAHTDSKPFLFGKLMEKGEESGAARVVAASVRDTFKTMIPKAMPDLAKEVEAGVLTKAQADKFTSLLLKHNGNVGRAVESFREIYKTGAVEAWRNLDHVSSFEKDALEGLGYWDEIEELATRGANSTDEVEAVFSKIQKSIDSRSEMATGDVIGLSADHPNAETWGDLMKAVDEGHLNPGDHQVFTAIMESAEHARLEYQTLLDDVALKAQQALSQEGKLEEAQHIGEEMNRVRDTLRKAAPATAKETHGITQDAWRWSDAIKAEKKPDIETLKSFWTKAGLSGEPPLDLTKQTLQKELWKQRFEKVTQTWNASLDAIVGESETIIKQMGGVVDTAELDAMAARTREITQKAQAYRTAVFDGKALRIKTPEDAFKLAKQYGVAADAVGKPLNSHIVNTVNKYLGLDEAGKYKKLEDIPLDKMKAAFEKRQLEKGVQAVGESGALPELKSLDWTPSSERVSSEAGGALSTSPTESLPGSQPAVPQTSTTASEPLATTRATVPSTTAGPATTRVGVGSIDQSSKRIVLQTSDSVEENLSKANAALPKLQALGDELASIIPGTEFVGARVKEMPRLNEKLQTRAANTISDYLGSRLTFDSTDDAEKIIGRLREKGLVVTADDFITHPRNGGYRAIHLQVDMGDGFTAELQLVPDEIAKVQNAAHAEYDVFRDPHASLEAVEAAKAKTETIFNAAWDKWEAKSKQIQSTAGAVVDEGVAVPPPHALGSQPSLPRAWNESAKGAKYTLERIKKGILDQWGKTDDARAVSADMEGVLSKISSEVTPKMAEIKATALRVAEQQREFTLLNYGKKTYGDVALSYLMPYHFFYTRSTKNWMSRIATNPEILAGYGKYKNTLEDINKDLPDWYKQQIDVTKLLGIPTDHPLFFNLESTFNPLYGLTGTDFNDPAKRTNAMTATFDDMGKFGPTIWAPIQMAIAAKLFADGETDAASRWGNRLIPETAQVKAVTSMFGKPIELDPAVNFFSGGKDPYERGRMGYAASQLIQSGQFTPEQVQEQFQQQEGPAWDQAYQMAVQSRAASSISSYFLGVGFKPRSTNDVMVEGMMTNLNKLYAMSDTMSPDQYKSEWEKLRSQYPDGLVDTVLLAKKGGDKRDAAYAFGVLGRLPPGEMSDVFKAIGISQKDVSRFYDSKGFADKNVKFTSTEKQRFMAAIVDLGAMLKIPDTATRAEWNDARSAYQDSYAEIKKQLGDDIWDKVTHYYDLKDDDKTAADQFKQAHPEVQMALQMKGEAVATSPLLSAYYGGIDNIEAYVSGKVRQQLSDKYGPEIYDLQTQYFDQANQKVFLRAHPELKRFWADKAMLDQQADKSFMEFGAKLPDAKGVQFRSDFTPESGVQQTMFNELQPQSAVPAWEDISQGMPEWLQSDILANLTEGRKLSSRAQKELDFLAKGGGFYDYKDMLRTAKLALQKSMQGPQVPQGQLAGSNPFGAP